MIYETANVDERTADAYERLLSDLSVLEVVPAWFTNRLTATPISALWSGGTPPAR